MFKRVKQYMALKIILTNCVVLMSVFFMAFMMVITRMNTIDELLVKSIEPDAQYFLVDQNGVLLMERSGEHFYQPLAEAYPQLCGFTPGESRTVTINGEKYLTLCERSEFSALTLYVMRPEQAVYAQGVSTYLLILAISALAGVLVMVITSVLTRRWVKPITSLADAMASFSRIFCTIRSTPYALRPPLTATAR